MAKSRLRRNALRPSLHGRQKAWFLPGAPQPASREPKRDLVRFITRMKNVIRTQVTNANNFPLEDGASFALAARLIHKVHGRITAVQSRGQPHEHSTQVSRSP